jgi:parallel beta-helix repeat protein
MMKKTGVFMLLWMLLIACITGSVTGSTAPEWSRQSLTQGQTFYVGGGGPGNYSTIQDAIDAASDGDTVFVYDDASPYDKNLVIEKSITLVGEDKETTRILGDESADYVIVNISADDVTISGFTIQPDSGRPDGIGIERNYTYPDYWNIDNIQNISITNTIIKKTGRGIFGIRLKYTDIDANTIENCDGEGILLFIASFTSITNNIVANCSFRGIEIDGLWTPYRLMNSRNPVPENNIISQNTVRSNRWGIEVNGGPRNTEISHNNITGNHEEGFRVYQASKTKIMENNFIKNKKNAYFAVVCALRYPQFLQNSWEGNYWDEPRTTPVRINDTYFFIPFPRIPISISFPNYDFNFKDISSLTFDWHPAIEPYDIPLPLGV